jgi:D-arabinose 1-dehydrogenase-like Zn-dependent alcohol dehydrogenase
MCFAGRQAEPEGMAVDGDFVGREPELALLRAAFDEARAGRPRVVLVKGPQGIGKTTLVDRFAGGVGDARVLRASGDESETVLAYVIGPHPGRLELALKSGARRAEEHDGDQDPLVFETAGVPAVWETANNAVAKAGKLVLIGFNDKPVHTTIDLVQRQLTIVVGQLIYDHPQDFRATLAAVTAGELVPQQTVQATFPVQDTAAALASVREIPGKTWIEFSSWREGGAG